MDLLDVVGVGGPEAEHQRREIARIGLEREVDGGVAFVDLSRDGEAFRELDEGARLLRRRSRNLGLDLGEVGVRGLERLVIARERTERGDAAELGALGADGAAVKGDRAVGRREREDVAKRALVVGELLQQVADVALLGVPLPDEVLDDRVGAHVRERRGVARVLVDRREDAELDHRVHGHLRVGLGLQRQHHLVQRLVLLLQREVHLPERDVVLGVALEGLADRLELLERAREIMGIREGRGEVELRDVVLGVHGDDALEGDDGARVVVLGDGLIRLLPHRRFVEEDLEPADDVRVLLAPGAALAGLGVVEKILGPLAGGVDRQALVGEAFELGYRYRDIRREALTAGHLLVQRHQLPSAFVAHGKRR